MITTFKNLSFRKKIFIMCLLVSLVPVIILGTFCYRQLETLLINREKTALSESLIQESYTLNSKLDSYQNTMNDIVWNENIRQALSKKYDNAFDMYLSYRDIIDPLFSTMRSLNKDIKSITIYTDMPINPHGNVLHPLNEIKTETWYQSISQNYKALWEVSMENKTLNLICQIYVPNTNHQSIAKIVIDYNAAFSSMESLYEQSYGILLTDASGIPVYQFDAFKNTDTDDALSASQLLNIAKNPDLQKKYVIEQVPNICKNWTLYLYRPIRMISAPTREITSAILIMIFVCLICVILLSFILSSYIVRPLEMLIADMNRVEQGEFTISVTCNSKDEIGRLIMNFQSMVQKLRHLVDEVLKSKIKQQEYEMRALQAQINPHFLYNSLSLINGKAIMSNQNEISQMAQFLSTFYRTTLNKGKNTISVKDELTNIRSYINIQFIMHSKSFDTIYDIDETILSYTMINLLLQPLAENAIIHGIDHREQPGKGLLKISGKQTAHTLIFKISDNGPGICPEKLQNILTSDSSGYGIQNVHHRVQLFYGEQYGLHYQSDTQGTTVTLTIPKHIIPSPTP